MAKTRTLRPRTDAADLEHAVVDGRHDRATCPSCVAALALRDGVSALMNGHPVDNIIILADFVVFAALETLHVDRGDTLDDQKLGLRLLSVLAERVNAGILKIQDDVRRAESLRAIGPTRPQ